MTSIPEYIVALIFFILLFALELFYFKLAILYKIIDKPNERSSHKKITIRGGGIIFPVAVLGWWIVNGFQFPLFVAGLFLVSIVSFVDDLNHIPSKVRFAFQFLAIMLLLVPMPFNLEWYWYLIIILLFIGILNAWNFMDGVNGITGSYSLVAVGTLYLINEYIHEFADSLLLVVIMSALVVFNFFNFRRKARCFAGDVGSVSIAFIISYLLIQLILSTGNVLYLGLILLYGLDTATTMFFRLVRGENIFEAHRSHLYQLCVNELRIPHLSVSVAYALIQGVVNAVLVTQFSDASTFESSSVELCFIVLISAAMFLLTRFYLVRDTRN